MTFPVFTGKQQMAAVKAVQTVQCSLQGLIAAAADETATAVDIFNLTIIGLDRQVNCSF